jgi:ATP-dependent Clp protease ATP-binding subunit ClpA
MILSTKNLKAAAKSGAIHDILHRELHLARLIRIIERSSVNNPLILGEPGVGKTSLLEGLACRMAYQGKKAPFTGEILQVDTAALAMLISNNDAAAIDAARTELLKQVPAVIIFDDARLLFTHGDISALIYFLQPLLEHPHAHVVLICGMAEYRRYIEREPILIREMEVIELPELSTEDSKDVLLSLIPSESFHNPVSVSSKVALECVVLAKRYVASRALPDKAIRLLHDASALAVEKRQTSVTSDNCKQIIAERTGIPVDKLSAAEQEKLLNLEKLLDAQVIGQPHITHAVSQVIRRSRAGLKDPGRPIASFLFLGSSGVGKTELAKVLSRTVFHNERALVRFDMSEFSESHTVQRLVGAPPGYVGFEEGGQLTNTVLAQPYSLILLDELEKAHPKVFDIFLQVMDDGRLTDGKGRTVDFSNTIIIATSNLALEEILDGFAKQEPVTEPAWYEHTVLPLLTSYFRPEFLNRFDGTLVFSPFTKDNLWHIAQLELKKLRNRLESLDFSVTINEADFKQSIMALYNPAYGARPIRRYLQQHVENELAEQILRGA